MARRILLTRGLETIVDDEWFEMLNQVKWHACSVKRGHAYAGRGFKKPDGGHGGELMSRVILSAKDGEFVDHINRDTLDNRMCNLRLCTPSQNAMNRKQSRRKSRFKGVAPILRSCKWSAYISKDGKTFYLGAFATEVDAALAYNKAASQIFGCFALLNDV